MKVMLLRWLEWAKAVWANERPSSTPEDCYCEAAIATLRDKRQRERERADEYARMRAEIEEAVQNARCVDYYQS